MGNRAICYAHITWEIVLATASEQINDIMQETKVAQAVKRLD